MRTFSSPAEFARELDEMDRNLATKTALQATRAQAQLAQKIATAVAAADLGGDPRFSGWRPELETRIKPIRGGKGVGHVLLPTRISAGPWTVAERGRNQGDGGGGAFFGPGVNRRTGETARTKAGRVRKVRAVKARRWNGRTQPKFTATKAVAQMDKQLPPIADKLATRQMRRHFDVTTGG